jgi:hypothetical protein
MPETSPAGKETKLTICSSDEQRRGSLRAVET